MKDLYLYVLKCQKMIEISELSKYDINDPDEWTEENIKDLVEEKNMALLKEMEECFCG